MNLPSPPSSCREWTLHSSLSDWTVYNSQIKLAPTIWLNNGKWYQLSTEVPNLVKYFCGSGKTRLWNRTRSYLCDTNSQIDPSSLPITCESMTRPLRKKRVYEPSKALDRTSTNWLTNWPERNRWNYDTKISITPSWSLSSLCWHSAAMDHRTARLSAV